MQRLILFRHGKTEGRAPSGEDFDRRLTARGRTDAVLTAQALTDAGFIPDLALVSAAARTRETWEAVAAVWPEARLDVQRGLYDADARTLLEAGKSPLGQTIVVIAHNPGLHVLALALLTRGGDAALERKVREGFPTAGAAVFGVEDEAVRALGVFFPRDYGGGQEG